MTSTRALFLATLPLAALIPGIAAAQTAPTTTPGVTPQNAGDVAPGDSPIIVTGTRRTDRTLAASPVPVDVIGTEAIVNSGQTERTRS